jgi:Tfp pilus assembly major pilin PilA
MSYHSEYHEFDFDNDLIDFLCPPTSLDHLIAKHGTKKALNKFSQPNKEVENNITMKNTINKKHSDLMMVAEHGLELTADPYRMKLIAEAISEYVTEHQLEDDTTLNDFRLNMETAYQSYYSLHQDDWGYVEEDREKVHGAF